MNFELKQQLDQWHEDSQFKNIVEAATAILRDERDYDLTIRLGPGTEQHGQLPEGHGAAPVGGGAGAVDPSRRNVCALTEP